MTRSGPALGGGIVTAAAGVTAWTGTASGTGSDGAKVDSTRS